MKRNILILLLMLVPLILSAQGRGIGYTLDMGGSLWSQSTSAYDQTIGSVTHNGFIRKHNKAGTRAFQFSVSYKTEQTHFGNVSTFLKPEGIELMNYNTDAWIDRTAWRVGMSEHFQFCGKPGKALLSVYPGIFYEGTTRINRYSDYDSYNYPLEDMIHISNLGYSLGVEIRLYFVTFGYKMEKLARDVLDHDAILDQELGPGNGSELRGLYMNPLMQYFYVGINLDYYRNRHKD